MYGLSYDALMAKASLMKTRTREFADIFYKYNSSKWLGCVSDEFTSAKPKTMKEWYKHYTTNVMSAMELYKLCEMIHRLCRLNCTVDDLFLYFVWEVIINVFDGFRKELRIMEMLTNTGHTCEHSTGQMDREYGIDFIVDDKYFIQVKPITFIRGNNNASLINDRRLAILKKEKALKDFGKPTYYMFYDKATESLVKGKNGKYCHNIDDLINNDGTLKCRPS